MRPFLVIVTALGLMGTVMYFAVRADCVRIAEDHEAELTQLDAEMQKLEDRYVKLVGRTPTPGPTPLERHFWFRRLHESQADASDEAAGIVNRWEILDREYVARAAERDAYRKSWRGGVAQGTGAAVSASASGAAK